MARLFLIASNGYSCGGLMAQGTVLDSRIVTWGVTSSGMAGATREFYDAIHTPVLFVEGGREDVAYAGALEGYEAISWRRLHQDQPCVAELVAEGGPHGSRQRVARGSRWLLVGVRVQSLVE